MAAEIPQAPDQNEKPSQTREQELSSLLERTDQALKDNTVKEGETRGAIQGKIGFLGPIRDQLQSAYDEANLDQRYRDSAKLFSAMTQIDERIKILEEAQAKAPYEAAPLSKKKMEKGEDRLKTKAKLEADMAKQQAIIDSTDPKVTAAQKKAALEARANDQEAIQKLEKQDEKDALMARTEKYHERMERYKKEEEASKKEDEAEAAALLATLEGGTPEEGKKEDAPDPTPPDKPADPNAPTTAPEAAPETGDSFADRTDNFVKGMIFNILGSPPKTEWDKYMTSSKVLMMRIAMAIGGEGDHTWGNKLDDNQKEMLKKITGLTITEDGKNDADQTKYKLEWGEPDPEFRGPSKTTQDVFAQYCKDDWMKSYQRVSSLADGKATVEDVEKSIAADTPPTEEDLELQAMISALDPEKKDVNFLDLVAKRGYSLLGREIPETTTDAMSEFTQTSLRVIEEKHFNSSTGTKDFLLAAFNIPVEGVADAAQLKAALEAKGESVTPDLIEAASQNIPYAQFLQQLLAAGVSGGNDCNKVVLEALKKNDAVPEASPPSPRDK